MKLQKIEDKMVYMDNTFTKRVLFNEEKVLNFILNLMPGQEIPPHQHENSDLIMYITVGGGELNIDNKIYDVSEGDVIYCEGSEVFSFKNNTAINTSAFVVIAPSPKLKAYSNEIGK